jgi:hypothetical protein
MHTITSLNVLLRDWAVLPAGLRLVTEAFRKGWSFMPKVNAQRLEQEIRRAGSSLWTAVPCSRYKGQSGDLL